MNVFKEANKKGVKMNHNFIVNTPCHSKAREIEQERCLTKKNGVIPLEL